MAIKFTPETIEELFGKEAAENEDAARLKRYFFKNKIYEHVRANLPLRLLVAHKGIGKSAMFKICAMEDKEQNDLSLWVRPDDLYEAPFPDTTDLNELIRHWKKVLVDIIIKKIIDFSGNKKREDINKTIHKTGTSLINDIAGYFKSISDYQFNYTQKLIIDKFIKNKKIIVYIDDLDRGWEGKKEDIRKISALLNALRDLTTDFKGIYFRIGLRADVYFLVRTSDESTDKIDGSVIWYKWTNHEIFKILVKRIAVFLGEDIDQNILDKTPQRVLSKRLNSIMEEHFRGLGHWANAPMYKVLLSLVRKRPRDLVKLCAGAAGIASIRDHNIITTKDFEDSFENYSQGRLQDTINEYRTELPDIERLLFGMKPSKKERRAALGYQYTTANLLKKISEIRERGQFCFANGKVATNKDLANFMYKINFLTARKTLADGRIDRKYFDENRYISSRFVDFGYDWEVHPAYRWALQPDNIADIFNRLQLTDINLDE